MADENFGSEGTSENGVVESGGASPDLGGGAVSQTPPKNYLVMAILVTIFCCWPLGIPAIVFAAQVNSKFSQGDYDGAVSASEKAKMWSIIALVAGLIFAVLYILLMMGGVLAGASAGQGHAG